MIDSINTHQVDHVEGFRYCMFIFRYTTLIILLYIFVLLEHDQNPTKLGRGDYGVLTFEVLHSPPCNFSWFLRRIECPFLVGHLFITVSSTFRGLSDGDVGVDLLFA